MSRRKWIILGIVGPLVLIAFVWALARTPDSPFEQLDPTVRVLGYKVVTGRSRPSMFLGGSELEGRIKQPIARLLGWFRAGSIIRPPMEVQLGTPPPNEFAIMIRYLDEAATPAPLLPLPSLLSQLRATLEDANGHSVDLKMHGTANDASGRERVVLWYLASVPEGFEKRSCRLVLKRQSKLVATANIPIELKSNRDRQ